MVIYSIYLNSEFYMSVTKLLPLHQNGERMLDILHLSHNLRSGSAITPCRKSHIALVQYRFMLPRFPVVTLLQTGRKWRHLGWRYRKQRHVFAGYIGRRHCKKGFKAFKMCYVIKRILHSCSLHIVFMKRVYYNDMKLALKLVSYHYSKLVS